VTQAPNVPFALEVIETREAIRKSAGTSRALAGLDFSPTLMEAIMRMHFSSAAAGFLILAGVGAAAAQDVIITPQQETVIREYVQKKPLASVKLPGVELNIGSTMPDTVELQQIDVPDVQYRYVVVDGQTVLVDPGTRKIVRVMK
jgi:hypothetical protein